MNRPGMIDSKRIEEEYESPRLRGPLFAGIVVFTTFSYRGLGALEQGNAYDPRTIRRSNSFLPGLAGVGMKGNGLPP
jgi:hypothetical protein